MELNLLKNVGLTDGELKIYNTLLENGDMTAGMIIDTTKLKRGDCYNKIYDLKEKGLVEELEIHKIKHFRLEHPNKVTEYINNKLEQISETKKEFVSIVDNIVSKYNLNYHKPSVTFYEGLSAMEKIYDDIIKVGKDCSVVISKRDKIYEEKVLSINRKHIKDRIKKRIKLIGLSTFEEKKLKRVNKDKVNLYKRNWVLSQDYNAPVQINIYGEKVSFLSFGKEFISLLIESPQISKAMRQLFDLATVGAKCNFSKYIKKNNIRI